MESAEAFWQIAVSIDVITSVLLELNPGRVNSEEGLTSQKLLTSKAVIYMKNKPSRATVEGRTNRDDRTTNKRTPCALLVQKNILCLIFLTFILALGSVQLRNNNGTTLS